jgi:hypothetical protein
MLIKKISFPNPMEYIEDINIDIFVKLENGHMYGVLVENRKNILSLMDK